MYTRRDTLDKELDPGPTPAVFDMLYSLIDKVWSYHLSKWRKQLFRTNIDLF